MSCGWRLLRTLVGLCLVALAATGWARPAEAVDGRLELASVAGEPVYLRGQWGFAWHAFVDPRWEVLPTRARAPVPSSWNDLVADGKPPGENGWGSYVLQVDCPQGRSLAVEATGQRTTSRLFVNGELVAAHGRPGTSAERNWAAIHTRVPISREFACPLRVTLHVANFDHRAGGFVRPLAVGPADVLARERESRVIHHAALLSAYLLTSVVSLIFFLVRRRERTTLVYGLFCIAMAVYTDMIGERLFLRPLPPQLSWFAYMRVEYLAWIAAMGLFLMTLRGLFPAEIHRRGVQAVVGVLALAALSVLALPPGIYSYLALPGQSIALLVAVYMAAAILRARRRSPVDAQVLLAGFLAIVVGFTVDFVLLDAPGPDRKFAPFGFALFLLSPAIVLGRRLSRALNAEERSRALEENARLREDVERISRHDLKTPLNSMIGVVRLLRDDPTLGPEQRGLVGILQRASLRMLEMVNLSLGLFRMETGTYVFRPQAVDLREVVAHALVDLQSHADAHGVRLQFREPPAAPVYVRGEELLCYSIVANTMKNAVEAAGAGRHVSVTLQPGDPVRLAVHNPGVVAPDMVGRFFEKYVTNKRDGTGLGTYSARLMARTQQGDLVLQTSAAQGTTLTLTLPAFHGEPLPAAPDPQARSAADRQEAFAPRRVLLVDDDESTRLVASHLLPRAFAVETAANGQAAIECMARRWPDYLLIDMEMPVRNGLQTVRWVRGQESAEGRPRCRVVMVSANDDPASAARAFGAGADRFLAKPVSPETWHATFRALEAERQGDGDGGDAWPLPVPSLPAAVARPADEARIDVIDVDPAWGDAFPRFVRLQQDAVEEMAAALSAGNRERLKFLAHRASGGLAIMGLGWAAGQSRSLEAEASDGGQEHLERRIAALREHLGRLRIETV